MFVLITLKDKLTSWPDGLLIEENCIWTLLMHRRKFDLTGSTTSVASPVATLRKSHGIVNIFAWAILAPIGGFIARYLRQRAPMWYYLHISFQASSFLLAIVGVGLGIKLTHELPSVSWGRHRLIGILVLLFASLQVCHTTIMFLHHFRGILFILNNHNIYAFCTI